MFTADEAAVAELSQALVEAGALIHALAPQTVTLEDLFFSYTEGERGAARPRTRAGRGRRRSGGRALMATTARHRRS